MKKFLSIFLLLILLTSAQAESRWQDAVRPGKDVEHDNFVHLITEDTGFLEVGRDIPAGLYLISPGYIGDYKLRAFFAILIMDGADIKYKSDVLNTETHPGLIVYVEDGQSLLVSVSSDVVYISSIDDVLLRTYE